MNVLPQDQADFMRLKAMVERMEAHSAAQARARMEVLAKLSRYQLVPAGGSGTERLDREPGAQGGAGHLVPPARTQTLATIQRY